MQYSEIELMKKIDVSQYVYFLKASIGVDQELARMIFTLDRDID